MIFNIMDEKIKSKITFVEILNKKNIKECQKN